jgi:hypothetical protein
MSRATTTPPDPWRSGPRRPCAIAPVAQPRHRSKWRGLGVLAASSSTSSCGSNNYNDNNNNYYYYYYYYYYKNNNNDIDLPILDRRCPISDRSK